MSIDKMDQNCQIAYMQMKTDQKPSDAKLKSVLMAAFEAFSMYGFRRTSMEDIARAAGMSRAALYLHFKNKEDIFRSMVATYYQETHEKVRQVLAENHPPHEALKIAFEAQSGEAFRALLDSPHGEELLDTKQSCAADVAQDGESALALIYAEWLEREDLAKKIDLSTFDQDAQALAKTMLKSLYGLKSDRPDYASYAAGRDRLALLFGRGLAV